MLFIRSLFLTAVLSSVLLSPVFASGEGGSIEIKEDEGTFTGSLSPLPRKPDTKRSGTSSSSSPRNQGNTNAGSSSSSRNRSPSPRREGKRSATSVSTVTTQSEAQAPSSAVVLSTQQGHSETDVSEAEWAKVMGLIPLSVSMAQERMSKESGFRAQLEQAQPGLRAEAIIKRTAMARKEAFDHFHSLYRSLKGQIPSKVRESFALCFLSPLCDFVFTLEFLFDGFRAHYRNQGQDSNALQREYLPILQKMFNRMIWAWEQLTGKRAALIGPVEGNVKVVINNNNKHLFYKRDKNGFLLFSVHPHDQLGSPEDNFYKTYIPYASGLGGEAPEHCIVFSLAGEDSGLSSTLGNVLPFLGTLSVHYAEDVRVVGNSGLILERRDQGKVFSIIPYHGEEADVPYTNGNVITLLHDNQVARAQVQLVFAASLQGNDRRRKENLHNLQVVQRSKRSVDAWLKDTFDAREHQYLLSQLSGLQDRVDRLQAVVDKDSALEEGAQRLVEEASEHIPPSLRGRTVISTDIPFEAFHPQILKWVRRELGQQDSRFIPFPRPGVEEQEETYCLLLDIQQRVSGNKATEEDILLLEYIKASGQTLEQAVVSLEADLLEGYVSEEQRQLEEEWAARKQQVIEEGQAAATKPTGKHAKSNKKKREKKKAATKAGTTTTASAIGSSVTNTTTASAAAQGSSGLGLTSTSTEDQTAQATLRAKKRLAKLQEEQRKGRPTKYRRFMGLLGLAADGLKKLGVNVSVTSNKGSHGTLVVDGKDRKDEKEDKKQEGKQEGKSKATLVRPHGRHDSLHPRGQKGLLNGLVSRFTSQFSSMASAGNTASNR